MHNGSHRYYIGTKYAVREAQVTFDAEHAAFICHIQGFEDSIMAKPKGLTKQALMGNLAEFLNLPAYQLALPFSVEDQHRLELANLVGNTTFPDFA